MTDFEAGIHVNGRVTIPRDEIEVRVSRSGGPGGQHVNTSSTRVEVRWSLTQSRALSPDEKDRARDKLGARLDADGTLRVTSSDSRSQRRNRDLAEARLGELVRRALVVPKARRATKRPRSADERRLSAKRERSDRKQSRRWNRDD
ncbi:MAG TPA: alternative ribosome rescue aminoacyl-tRNA hydrolase ArfB [Gemmatimonadaceae bacterium]|nr:alternative ribosome rescue aminoacyl-tRNA hydrolase ArfB [Gemmatimonadaceae bacterium]